MTTDTRPPLPRRLLRWEAAMWGSLFRWLARRPAVPGGAAPFGYAKAKMPVLVTFVGVCALETVAFHLLIPWLALRVVVDVLSVYGLIWMVGVLAGTYVHPHLIASDGLRVRNGFTLDVAVPWEAVAAVRRQLRPVSGGRTVHIDRSGGRAVASIAALGQTTVDVVLRRPVTVPAHGGAEPVDEIRFHADDPAALVAAAHQHLPPAAPTS
jgi:hypothetical protein